MNPRTTILIVALALAGALLVAGAAPAQDFTSDFGRDRCTFTTVGSNPYFPLWPGYALVLEGEELDEDEELVTISAQHTVLLETEMVDGVQTRVFEERELEDGALVEVSRNFLAVCRESGDLWYFGEDVDIVEDGEIVSHDGAWRAGVNGAEPGVLMLGTPTLGARYREENAPGVAEDRAEVVSMGEEVTVPAGTFERTLGTVGTTELDPGAEDDKQYAYGVGLIVDQSLELIEILPPTCQPDATTHCLNDGRFRVTVEWEDFEGATGHGTAILPTDESGEFWFFSPDNSELLVKVLDGCDLPGFNSFWVFAGGLTNVGVTLTVEDTVGDMTNVYTNLVEANFQPILDTSAFATCP